METKALKADRRNPSRKGAKVLRREGKLPAIIYGREVDPVPITLDTVEATQVLRGTSSSTLLTLEVDGEEYTTLVRERQRDFIKGHYLHVDFLAVSLTEKVSAKVNLNVIGTAPALEEYDCVVVTGLDQVEVESLPQDLPDQITVDLSGLEEIGDGIWVRDLTLPPNVEVMNDPDEMIAVVTSHVVEEEEEEEEELELVDVEPELVAEGEEEEWEEAPKEEKETPEEE